MDVPSPVPTWIVADRRASSAASRHSLLSTFTTGLGFRHHEPRPVTRVNVPDGPTDPTSVPRPAHSTS